jgi:UMF1 family MFS transporter
LYGAAAHRFGPKKSIYFALLVYVGACLWALQMKSVREFYVMAIIIGCVQGGVQGLSRSLYASLIPANQPGEFFGFYNMTTKLAHVLGPAMVAVAAMLSDDPKWVLLVLMPLFLCGGFLLALVRERAATS